MAERTVTVKGVEFTKAELKTALRGIGAPTFRTGDRVRVRGSLDRTEYVVLSPGLKSAMLGAGWKGFGEPVITVVEAKTGYGYVYDPSYLEHVIKGDQL